MAIRLIECQRILKNSGSIYLHCDPTMSHYLKLVMDCIFEEKNNVNEIIWHYYSGRGGIGLNKKHDTILFYAKNKNMICLNKDECKEKSYRTIPNLQKGKEGEAKIGKGFQYFYYDKEEGKHYSWVQMHDVWTDISYIQSRAKERTGYPTQKPLALLERIIKISCPKDGIILDPFCGCATACVAAEKLNRKWIGIDVSVKAYELVKMRLDKECGQGTIWDHERIVHYYTNVPKRTDLKNNYQNQKWIYIISNPQYKDEYKVGVASNLKSRLSSYQTSDPNRSYRMEYTLLVTNFNEIEKAIHNKFDNRYEWVKASLDDIKDEIIKLSKK